MIKSIFEYRDYKPYLKDFLNFQSKKEWGYKQNTATAIGCKASYLSQILSGKPDLSLEQAHKLNQRFNHDKTEARYFILLVELGRAHTADLKKFFLEQIHELQESRYDLKKRLQASDQVSKEDMDKYYSSWLYSAVHIALALPGLQNAKAISNRFNIPEEMAVEIVQFMENSGLVEKVEGKYNFTKKRLHLDRNSNFIQRHHINWRSQALQSVEKNYKDDMHFSTVFAITQTDFNKIKEIFIKSIESAREIIGPSDSEELYSITLDLFKVS